MKTSVMEVDDLLSALSVAGVEARIGEVPGVESATVNHANKTATVRYDETRLDVAGIKSAVRQQAYQHEDAAPPKAAHEPGHNDAAGKGQPEKAPPKPTADATAAPMPSAPAGKEGPASTAAHPDPAREGSEIKPQSSSSPGTAPPGPAAAMPK